VVQEQKLAGLLLIATVVDKHVLIRRHLLGSVLIIIIIIIIIIILLLLLLLFPLLSFFELILLYVAIIMLKDKSNGRELQIDLISKAVRALLERRDFHFTGAFFYENEPVLMISFFLCFIIRVELEHPSQILEDKSNSRRAEKPEIDPISIN
jgi:predicted tellurium resistance membrane protein TerC